MYTLTLTTLLLHILKFLMYRQYRNLASNRIFMELRKGEIRDWSISQQININKLRLIEHVRQIRRQNGDITLGL